MKRRLAFPIILVMVALSIFFFTRNRLDHRAEEAGYKTVPVYTDPSRPIPSVVGKEFTITLDSNPTTGYSWRIAGSLDAGLLKVVQIQHKTSKSKLIGAGGKDMWTFRGLKEGQGAVSLEYVRPWEKDVPPVKTAKFSVIIKK
jgi:inhibitor of cysteine peptidase